MRLIKGKLSWVLGIVCVIIMAIILYANQDKPFEEVLAQREIDSFTSIDLVSIEYLSANDYYTYELMEDEVIHVQEIISIQQLNRSYFNNYIGSTFKYRISLKNDKGATLIDMGSEKLHIQDTNLYYELKSDELDSYIMKLLEANRDL